MNISQPEPEDPALTPVHASEPSPTELLKAALSSDAPLAERFSPHEFAACVPPPTPTATRGHREGREKVLSSAPPKQLRSWAAPLMLPRGP